MTFPPDLLAAYQRTLKFIYDSGLDIFYRQDGEDDISASEEEMVLIKKAVETHKKTYIDMHRFKFNYLLWRDLTKDTKLPMAPLKQLLPEALSWWNINKPTGDTITEMLWNMMYYSPVSNPQAVLVKRLAHQLPTYMCHRLFQLFSTSRDPKDFSSIYQYRDATRNNQTFFDSTRDVGSSLRSMAEMYNPERPLAPAAQPPALAVAGTYTIHGAFPPTGQSPMRRTREWYENPANSQNYAFQRRHNCVGCSVLMVCDENGDPLKGKTCAHCRTEGATWWCTMCRVFLHGLPPRACTLADGGTPLLMAAAAHMPANSRKRSLDGELVPFYTRMSCSDKHHQNARERAFGNINSNSMVSISWLSLIPASITSTAI
jgi:hypothetical protein